MNNTATFALVASAAVVDGCAVMLPFVAPQYPHSLGLLLHAVLCLCVTVGALRLNLIERRKGRWTLGVLVALVMLLTPVFGILATGHWIRFGARKGKRNGWRTSCVTGNPVRRKSVEFRPPHPVIWGSKVAEIEQLNGSQQQTIAGLLRKSFTASALSLLRELTHQPDTRTRLFALTALASLSESNETAIVRLRRSLSNCPEDRGQRERLGQALYQRAVANVAMDFEKRAWLEEAAGHFSVLAETMPDDIAILEWRAKCLLALRKFPELDEVLVRLRSKDHGGQRIRFVEAQRHALLGDWAGVVRSVSTAADSDGTGAPLFSDASISFWNNQTRPPTPVP